MTILPPARADWLRAAALTYSAPAGRSFTRSRVVNHDDFERAVRDLMGWRVHERAGLTVAASSPTATEGTVVEMRLGVRALALRIPCRVVSVVDEPDQRGFAYGTLPGHPESGEESFVLRRLSDGRIELTVSAFSSPATRLARLAGPLGRRFQDWMTDRYLAALDR